MYVDEDERGKMSRLDDPMEQVHMKPAISVEDIFIHLPKDVAAKITNLLSFEEITRLSFSSRKMQNFCLSVPFVAFPKDVAAKITNLLSFEEIARLSFSSQKMQNFCLSVPLVTSDFEGDRRLGNKIVGRKEFLNHVVSYFVNTRRMKESLRLTCFTGEVATKLNRTLRMEMCLDEEVRDKRHVEIMFLTESGDLCEESKTFLSSTIVKDTEELVIGTLALELLYKNELLPLAFSKLQFVRLFHDSCSILTIPVLACFLEGVPGCLKKLVLHGIYSFDIAEYDSKFWGSKNFAFLRELERVSIYFNRYDTDSDGSVMVEWLLQEATRLKKMKIGLRKRNGFIPLENILKAKADSSPGGRFSFDKQKCRRVYKLEL